MNPLESPDTQAYFAWKEMTQFRDDRTPEVKLGWDAACDYKNKELKAALDYFRCLDYFRWIPTKDELPSAPIPFQRESLLCLCIHKSSPRLLRWNYHYKVWDDEEGDDFFCAPLDVDLWMPFPDWPKNV
jgi:hypothetical protein